MNRRLAVAVAAGALMAGIAQAAAEPSSLQPGAGEDLTSAHCNICHSTDYIVMNSVFLTQGQWKAEVTRMRTSFGATIDDATASAIAAYLATHYAVAEKP